MCFLERFLQKSPEMRFGFPGLCMDIHPRIKVLVENTFFVPVVKCYHILVYLAIHVFFPFFLIPVIVSRYLIDIRMNHLVCGNAVSYTHLRAHETDSYL